MDQATGLIQAQQRYYDPLTGRFLSPDPMAVDPNTGWNFNRYAYANNNPYKYTDPDGRVAVRSVGPWRCDDQCRAPRNNWPVPGHTELNKKDKPKEGDGKFGSCRGSGCSRKHEGVDIQAPEKSDVVAVKDGNVTGLSDSASYGKQVLIKHGDGIYSLSAHLSSKSVKTGDAVVAGQKIGEVGRTGNTPPAGDTHLHFEIRGGTGLPTDAVRDPAGFISTESDWVTHDDEY